MRNGWRTGAGRGLQPSVGVLALQGGVKEHRTILHTLGLNVVPVRTPEALNSISALFLPGGESTTLILLLDRWGLTEPIISMGKGGFPIFGTCAGAVLLASEIFEKEHPVKQKSLGLAKVRAIRNYFGRQAKSFIEDVSVSGLSAPFRGVFIRAPMLQPLSSEVQVLSSIDEGPAMLRQNNLWLSSFHPELTGDARLHRLFLQSSGLELGS